MASAHRRRAALVAGVILASLLIFGCDYFDGLSESAGENQSEEQREQIHRELTEPPEAQDDGDQMTGAQDSPAKGPITAQEIAGTYSASAELMQVGTDVESADSLPVTVQLNENGTGTATVNGYSGAAQFSGTSVSFSVTMEEGGQSVVCNYKGVAARSEDESQMAITGTMNCSMMGVNFASYGWTAYK